MATKIKAKKATDASNLRNRWTEALAPWSKLLPRPIYTDTRGTWRFAQPETREELIAAGWEPLACQVLDGKTGKMVPAEGWSRGPQPLWFAEQALADAAKQLADAAVVLRVNGSADLRNFERELRNSHGEPSRNPSLMLNNIEAIVTDVLLAHEAEAPQSPPRRAGNLDEKGAAKRRPVLAEHRKVHAVLARDGGAHGLLLRDILVPGIKGKKLQRRLDVLRENEMAELVKGTRRWRAIGQ